MFGVSTHHFERSKQQIRRLSMPQEASMAPTPDQLENLERLYRKSIAGPQFAWRRKTMSNELRKASAANSTSRMSITSSTTAIPEEPDADIGSQLSLHSTIQKFRRESQAIIPPRGVSDSGLHEQQVYPSTCGYKRRPSSVSTTAAPNLAALIPAVQFEESDEAAADDENNGDDDEDNDDNSEFDKSQSEIPRPSATPSTTICFATQPETIDTSRHGCSLSQPLRLDLLDRRNITLILEDQFDSEDEDEEEQKKARRHADDREVIEEEEEDEDEFPVCIIPAIGGSGPTFPSTVISKKISITPSVTSTAGVVPTAGAPGSALIPSPILKKKKPLEIDILMPNYDPKMVNRSTITARTEFGGPSSKLTSMRSNSLESIRTLEKMYNEKKERGRRKRHGGDAGTLNGFKRFANRLAKYFSRRSHSTDRHQ